MELNIVFTRQLHLFWFEMQIQAPKHWVLRFWWELYIKQKSQNHPKRHDVLYSLAAFWNGLVEVGIHWGLSMLTDLEKTLSSQIYFLLLQE